MERPNDNPLKLDPAVAAMAEVVRRGWSKREHRKRAKWSRRQAMVPEVNTRDLEKREPLAAD